MGFTCMKVRTYIDKLSVLRQHLSTLIATNSKLLSCALFDARVFSRDYRNLIAEDLWETIRIS